jgi:hypothetical protein
MGTTRDVISTGEDGAVTLGIYRPRTYNDLNDAEKKLYDADIRASNIVIQGLPKDVYKLINFNTEAKAVWDNVKILLAGSELTKEDRESQLYDETTKLKANQGTYTASKQESTRKLQPKITNEIKQVEKPLNYSNHVINHKTKPQSRVYPIPRMKPWLLIPIVEY